MLEKTPSPRDRAPAITEGARSQQAAKNRKRAWPPELRLRPGMTWEDLGSRLSLGVDDDDFVLEYYRPRLPGQVIDRIIRATNVSKKFRRTVGDSVARNVCSALWDLHVQNLVR